MTELLEGKVAFVSGVGPGMGRDIALQLATHGADVVLGARTVARCDEVADEVRALGRRATTVRLDVTDDVSAQLAVDAAVAEHGTIDILVNNAFHDGTFKRFIDAPVTDWHTTMDVNLWGTLRVTRFVAEVMRERGGGRVVMVNSMSSVRVEERFGAYTASKAALAAATKTLAKELGRFGIRVNGVHPGYIWGDSVEQYLRHKAQRSGTTFEEQYELVAAQTSLGYIPTSEEIAGAVVFLASDLAKPITGQALHVNAGHWFEGF